MKKLDIPFGPAICYSGYREGQSPDTGVYPTYEQMKEDLLILAPDWKYLRVYDCSPHTQTLLEVIKNEGLDFKVMLGVYIGAEVNNPNCPWGGMYEPEVLKENRRANVLQVDLAIELANRYQDIVFSVSAGNEATVEWNDHMVPVVRVIEYVRRLKKNISQPVTFCENYAPWLDTLTNLVNEVDFISIHTYPLWEYKKIDEAIGYTQENYEAVANLYPHKTVVITEAGWTTKSNGRGMPPENANEDFQKTYLDQLEQWTTDNEILTFVFEAFDEPWKGSEDPDEPEKHWGVYTVDRKPKKVMDSVRRQ
jgi:exo-beta-1,3-glucanase (GH17 family)